MSDKNIENSCEKMQKTKKNTANSGSEESADSEAHDGSSAESGSESSASGASRCSSAAAECPICLRSLTSQNIGFPEDCASTMHIFCAICIEEWSKNVTTCPIDRKEFTSIRIMESWSDRTLVRSIKVDRKEFNEGELHAVEEDLTYCEVCQQSNREHMMLLCDDCDKGFHMDCLTPVLREIPAGSWFCPRCDPESVAVSSESETEAPRIIRTRQTERIRTAILVRNRIASPEPEPQPGPSTRTIQSTLERVRRRLTAHRTRRRHRRKFCVTIDEYDINSDDEKFPIRRKVRRGKTRRKRRGKRAKKSSSCREHIEGLNDSGIPTLRLFEPANNLEYFPDEDTVEDVPTEVSSGNVMIRVARYDPSTRTALRRKQLALPTPAPSNILELIMEGQTRMYSKGGGFLNTGKSVFKKPLGRSAAITRAPLNGTGEQPVNVPPSGAVNQAATETNTSNTQSSGGSAATTTGGNTAMSTGSEGAESNGRSFRYSYVPLQQVNNTTTPKKGTDMFEDEENCPNFSVYSMETMSLAKQSKESEEKQAPVVETDVDLVQLSGDEEEDPAVKDPLPPPAVPASKWKPVAEEVQKDEQERSRVLKLYDSDGDNIEEWNKDAEDVEITEEGPKVAEEKDTEVPPEEHERSYTPCLDENQPKDTDTPLKVQPGIDGMETELISEEEDSNLNENLELFKRGTKAKERNYREKRSRSPRKSRSAEDKENRKRHPRDHRKELPRYDVRNIIARAGQRDPFGRNKARNQSRSRSPHGSPHNSRSRSVSRRSFTISRSPSYDRPVFRRGSPRSTSPHRGSGSPKRAAVRRRRSTSRSRSKSAKRVRGDLPRRKSKSPGGRKRKPKKDKLRKRKQRPKDKRKVRSRSKSSLPPGWSRDASPGTPPIADRSWTPPITGAALPKTAENLRVVVNNRESPSRAKKKEKKKKGGKKKEKRKERNKHRHEKATETSSRPGVAASKEVFASGENILVSVSFNNVQEKQKTPERRVERDPTKILQLPVPVATKTRRHKKTDAKPVAIIDLDGSPFNEVPPSPVIILSDSDHETNDAQPDPSSEVTLDEVIRPASPPESPTAEEQFRAPAGPKTPPEPPQLIKFSVPSKTVRMRQINTIFDTENDVSDDAANEPQKIGPNTPPEPTSPDVYDPFEPTKSPSEHSDGDRDDGAADDGPPSRSSTPPLEETEANLHKNEVEKSSCMNPVDLVMSLINKSASMLHDADAKQTLDASKDDNANADDSEKQIQVLSNVVVTPAKSGGQYLHPRTAAAAAAAASTTTPHKIPTPTYKPTQKSKTHGTVISKLPLPRKPETIEIDSPYSPGSSDFDDLFEPPTSTTDTFKPHKQPNVTSSTSNNRGGMSVTHKVDMFDNLFGSTSPVHNKFSNVTSTYKTKGVKRRKRRSRKIDDDEIPSSAVELQVKDKLLRKLNRQERVIEEVKLVIKPHYNKKRITKEEYKEIMRKAVPKICHSKSGEINPVKISALVEAYVKKVRYRRKNQMKMQTT